MPCKSALLSIIQRQTEGIMYHDQMTDYYAFLHLDKLKELHHERTKEELCTLRKVKCDYIKVFKKNKAGLSGKLKVVGQIVLGIVVGSMIYFHPDITIKEKQEIEKYAESHNLQKDSDYQQAKTEFMQESSRSTKTTIPFVKNNEFDYSWLIKWVGDDYKDYAWIIFIPIVIFFITAISNGANLTDGIDGLATGTSAIIGACLAVLAWVSGNIIFADYLNIMYIPNVGELTIYIAAFVGATIGFLWYNTYPAQIFMGDTGSLAIGGIIAVFAILIRKELLIPILCGVFIAENLSVVMQVSYFKFTKKKYGEGKRIFLMAPLHHHYQKKGYAEPKIVQRFMIISIILLVGIVLINGSTSFEISIPPIGVYRFFTALYTA